MKRVVTFLLLGLLAIFFQGALLHCGVPPYLMPQLVTLLVVYLAFHEVSVAATFLVFVLGLLLDFASAVLIGPWAGALVAVYGVLAVLSQRLFIESGLVAMVTAFFAAFGADVIYLILAYEYRPNDPSYPFEAVGQALVTALLAPIMISLLSQRMRRRAAASMGRTSAINLA